MSLQKMTIKSIKFMLDVELFDRNSDLIVPTLDVHKVSLFFILLCILVKTFHRLSALPAAQVFA